MSTSKKRSWLKKFRKNLEKTESIDPEEARRREDAERKEHEKLKLQEETAMDDISTGYKKSFYIYAIFAGILIVLCLIALVYFYQPGDAKSSVFTKYTNKTVTTNESYAVSISEYSTITKYIKGQDVEILGYLQMVITTTRYNFTNVDYHIVDDYNNKIKLRLPYSGVNEYEKLFPKNTPTTQTYLISGILRSSYDGMIIDVNTIVPKAKNSRVVTKNMIVEENITTKSSKIGRLNWTYGMERLNCIFGCE